MFVDDKETYVASRLTTVDNNWNPFTQFSEWYNEDVNLGYNTCGLLAKRFEKYLKENNIQSAEVLSDYEYAEIIDKLILQIIDEFPLLYKRIEKPKVFIEID